MENNKIKFKLGQQGTELLSFEAEGLSEQNIDFLLRSIIAPVVTKNDVAESPSSISDMITAKAHTLLQENVEDQVAATIAGKIAKAIPPAKPSTATTSKSLVTPLRVSPMSESTKVYSTSPADSSNGNNAMSKVSPETLGKLYEAANVEKKPDDTEYLRTGIKYNGEGKPRYRLGYSCAKCGESGRHYIPLHVKRVNCHKCQTALIVEPATENGLGTEEKHRDEHGHYLVAKVIDINSEIYK